MFCVKYREKCKERGKIDFLLQFLFTKVDTSLARQDLDSKNRVCLKLTDF